MPDIASLPATPVAAPPHAGDMALVTRGPLPTDPPGTAASGYGVPYGSLAPAILPKSQVTAGGTNQASATALTTPIAVITGVVPGGGVVLRGIAHDTQTLLNASGGAVLVYPPAGGSINGLANAAPVAMNGAGQVDFHSVDGVSYFAGV